MCVYACRQTHWELFLQHLMWCCVKSNMYISVEHFLPILLFALMLCASRDVLTPACTQSLLLLSAHSMSQT